jgi:hypothetical protein
VAQALLDAAGRAAVHAVGGEAARWQADYGWTTVAIPAHSSFFSFFKITHNFLWKLQKLAT